MTIERTVKTGTSNGHTFRLMRRTPDYVLAGAALYALYVDDDFYCSCDSRAQADEEIKCL